MHVKLLYFCVNLSCELLKDHPIASLPAALKVIEITGKSHANISMYVDFFFLLLYINSRYFKVFDLFLMMMIC